MAFTKNPHRYPSEYFTLIQNIATDPNYGLAIDFPTPQAAQAERSRLMQFRAALKFQARNTDNPRYTTLYEQSLRMYTRISGATLYINKREQKVTALAGHVTSNQPATAQQSPTQDEIETLNERALDQHRTDLENQLKAKILATAFPTIPISAISTIKALDGLAALAYCRENHLDWRPSLAIIDLETQLTNPTADADT